MSSVQRQQVDDLAVSWEADVSGFCVNEGYLESVTLSNYNWFIEVDKDGTVVTYRREEV